MILRLLFPSFNFLSSFSKVTRVIASDCEGGYRQIRSSAWLEHYTDNVGVSSSNLLGSTRDRKERGGEEKGAMTAEAVLGD